MPSIFQSSMLILAKWKVKRLERRNRADDLMKMTIGSKTFVIADMAIESLKVIDPELADMAESFVIQRFSNRSRRNAALEAAFAFQVRGDLSHQDVERIVRLVAQKPDHAPIAKVCALSHDDVVAVTSQAVGDKQMAGMQVYGEYWGECIRMKRIGQEWQIVSEGEWVR